MVGAGAAAVTASIPDVCVVTVAVDGTAALGRLTALHADMRAAPRPPQVNVRRMHRRESVESARPLARFIASALYAVATRIRNVSAQSIQLWVCCQYMSPEHRSKYRIG